MFHVYRKELNWGGRRLVLETGQIARQADGAVLATYGETTVLCTALDLVVAGTGEGVLMVESEAKELPEHVMLGAVTFGHREFQPVIQAIIELAETCAREPWSLPPKPPELEEIGARLRDAVGPLIEAAYATLGKQDRSNRLDEAKAKLTELFPDEAQYAVALKLFKDIEKEIVRGAILRDGHRIDGRDTRTVRPI